MIDWDAGKPQVRRADQHEPGLAAAAAWLERVQVRVPAPAPGQFRGARLALGLVHGRCCSQDSQRIIADAPLPAAVADAVRQKEQVGWPGKDHDGRRDEGECDHRLTGWHLSTVVAGVREGSRWRGSQHHRNPGTRNTRPRSRRRS
jgi:hypothetical protein